MKLCDGLDEGRRIFTGIELDTCRRHAVLRVEPARIFHRQGLLIVSVGGSPLSAGCAVGCDGPDVRAGHSRDLLLGRAVPCQY